MDFLTWQTNELRVSFVVNNIVLLGIIVKLAEYVCKKTPWAVDDDLPSFLSGLINSVKSRGKK